MICLGLIAQHTSLTALEFSSLLNLPQQNSIRDWLGRLIDLRIVLSKGKTKGVEYFITPEWLRKTQFKGKTNLKRIEDYRLNELIYQDLKTYPLSSISEIHQRIGQEIPVRKIKGQLDRMLRIGSILSTGERRRRRYAINAST